MINLNRFSRCGFTSSVFAMFLSFGAVLSAADKFSGGEVKKGSIIVNFSNKGAVDGVSFEVVKLMRTNNGLTTTGSKDNEWEPWMPQMNMKDVVLTKEETPDCIIVTSSGILQSKDSKTSSAVNVINKVYADKIVLESSIKTPDKDLWKRGGYTFMLDTSVLNAMDYKADGGEWKAIPEVRGNRNLMWPQSASLLEVISEKYLMTFKLEGIKANLFDERKEKTSYIYIEANTPPAEIKEKDGSVNYGAVFTSTITFAQNKTGAIPVKPKPDPNAGSPTPTSSFDLSEKTRLVQTGDFRKRYSLDGQWDLMPLGFSTDFASDLFKYPVPAGKWKKAIVPMPKYLSDEWTGPQHAAWYRTQFTVPDDLKGKKIYLNFEEISFDIKVYLNGKEIGSRFGD